MKKTAGDYFWNVVSFVFFASIVIGVILVLMGRCQGC